MMATENSTDHEARQAAVSMLRDGLAGLSDVAELAGVSRQLVRYWADAAGVDWRAARARFLAKHWRRRMARKR